MICCSTRCERYNECGNTVDAARDLPGYYDTVEPLYMWGSASIGIDKDGNIINEAHYVCGPLGNWGLFFPKDASTYDYRKEKINVIWE